MESSLSTFMDVVAVGRQQVANREAYVQQQLAERNALKRSVQSQLSEMPAIGLKYVLENSAEQSLLTEVALAELCTRIERIGWTALDLEQ